MLPLSDPRSPVKATGLPRPPVLGALTSLRFLIALHVGFYHFVRPFRLWGPLASFFGAGYTGVSFFFLLSGFILTYAHAREYEAGRGSPRRFWIARFARIYPVYLLGVLSATYIYRGLLAFRIERVALIANVFMVQSWSSRLVRYFNVPAWSLSCEAFFYLLFPFLVLRLRRHARWASVLSIAGFVLLAMAAPAWGLLHYPAAGMHELPDAQAGYSNILRIRRIPLFALPEFLAGVSLGWMYVQHGVTARLSRVLAWGGGALLIAVLCVADRLPYVMLHNGLLIPLQCAVILGLCGHHGLTRLMSHRWLMLLGEASYSFYLFHLLLWDATVGRFHLQTNVATAVCAVVAIPVVALLLYRFVERPCRRLLLQRFASAPGVR